MSFLLEILGQGLLTELAAAFRDVLAEAPVDGSAPRDGDQQTEELVDAAVRRLRDHNVVAAERLFRRIIADVPDHRRARIGLACALDELGRTEEAIDVLHPAFESNSDDPALSFSIGYCNERCGATDAAIAYYRSTLTLCPGLRNARERLAAIHVRRNEISRAVEQYESISEREPDDVHVILSLAHLYHRAGRLDDAVERYRFALTIEPDNWGARDDLAATYDEAGMGEEAIRELQEMIAVQPAFPDNHLRLGDLYAKAARDSSALDEYMEALEIHPEYLEATVKVGTVHLRNGRYADAASWFNKALEINDRFLTAYVGLAVAHLEAGRPEEAEDTLDAAAGVEPNSALLFAETAKLHLRAGAGRQARQYLGSGQSTTEEDPPVDSLDALLDRQIDRHGRAALERPNHADLRYRLGLLLRQRGRREEAVECFRTALSINPNYIQAAIKLSFCLREAGDYDEAIDVLRVAMTDTRRDVELHYQLGLLFADRNRFPLALEQFEMALTNDPRNLDVHANLALALQNMGLLDRAAASWETLCETAEQIDAGRHVLDQAARCRRLEPDG